MTVLDTVLALGGFATVVQLRAAGHSDAAIVAADEAREVCLKIGNDPRRTRTEDCIVLGREAYQFVLA